MLVYVSRCLLEYADVCHVEIRFPYPKFCFSLPTTWYRPPMIQSHHWNLCIYSSIHCQALTSHHQHFLFPPLIIIYLVFLFFLLHQSICNTFSTRCSYYLLFISSFLHLFVTSGRITRAPSLLLVSYHIILFGRNLRPPSEHGRCGRPTSTRHAHQ